MSAPLVPSHLVAGMEDVICSGNLIFCDESDSQNSWRKNEGRNSYFEGRRVGLDRRARFLAAVSSYVTGVCTQ